MVLGAVRAQPQVVGAPVDGDDQGRFQAGIHGLDNQVLYFITSDSTGGFFFLFKPGGRPGNESQYLFSTL
jgi:hypothetical protein